MTYEVKADALEASFQAFQPAVGAAAARPALSGAAPTAG